LFFRALLSAAVGFVLFATAISAYAAPRYAAVVVDGNTGKMLFYRNGDARRYPASLTKIMTLYVLFDYLQSGQLGDDTDFYVTPYAASRPPSKMGLKAGNYVKVRDLIKALVTKSANDAATVIAENISGTEAKFARLMTATARKIGMNRSVFKNASGLPHGEQVTTARDMVTLAKRIMDDFPAYYKLFRTKHFNYKGRRYNNHNRLLFNFQGTEGIKTGYTRASGYNLTASVKRDGKHLIGVVFGGKTGRSRDSHMRKILGSSFRRASRQKIAWGGESKAGVAVSHHTAADEMKPQIIKAALGTPASRAEIVNTVSRGNSSSNTGGEFHVQIGAFSSKSDAIAQLSNVSQSATEVIGGYRTITQPVKVRHRTLYRARFGDFNQATAHSTCSRLKQMRISCAVMRAK
jgi:D-alanyl-D-alanine carboxypeptidase